MKNSRREAEAAKGSSLPSNSHHPNQFASAGPTVGATTAPSNRATARQYTEWSLLISAEVEIRYKGQVLRTGFVDDAMPDSSALWIAVDGNSPRQMFEISRGHEVWVTPRELPGGLHYRISANQISGARSARSVSPAAQVEPTDHQHSPAFK